MLLQHIYALGESDIGNAIYKGEKAKRCNPVGRIAPMAQKGGISPQGTPKSAYFAPAMAAGCMGSIAVRSQLPSPTSYSRSTCSMILP